MNCYRRIAVAEHSGEVSCVLCVRVGIFLLLSVGFGGCTNLPAGLLSIEHPTSGDQCKLTDVITQTYAFDRVCTVPLHG